MFQPHVNTGHIYILKGDSPDIKTFQKEEWPGKRTLRALETAIAKARDGGKHWAFIQYEDERTPLATFTPTELLGLGVVKNKATNNNDASFSNTRHQWADRSLTGYIPPRKKPFEIR